jgi:hypothetical protein
MRRRAIPAAISPAKAVVIPTISVNGPIFEQSVSPSGAERFACKNVLSENRPPLYHRQAVSLLNEPLNSHSNA